MKVEVERKFLVRGMGFVAEAAACRHLVQGYICRESGRTVRVRIDGEAGIPVGPGVGIPVGSEVVFPVGTGVDIPAGSGVDFPEGSEMGFLTIKGRSTADGTSRSEWEYEIPAQEARGLLGLCTGKIIDKDRYIVPVSGGDLKWEVDVFHGAHEGLVIAEIELPDAECPFERPSWLGEEVTGDRRYYNSVLAGGQ